MRLPLSGKSIALTGPASPESEALAVLIGEAGGRTLTLPLFRIVSQLDAAMLQRMVACLEDADLAVFVSPNAVRTVMPELLRCASWPERLPVVCPGPGTARSLSDFAIDDAVSPSGRHDSEALLGLPGTQPERLRGRRVLLFCGEGGRPLLAEALCERGAVVEKFPVYRRQWQLEIPGRLRHFWQCGQLDGLLLTSSASLRFLHEGESVGSGFLSGTPLFVPHARIAELAESLAIRHIVRTSSGNQGIVASLCAYNWP